MVSDNLDRAGFTERPIDCCVVFDCDNGATGICFDTAVCAKLVGGIKVGVRKLMCRRRRVSGLHERDRDKSTRRYLHRGMEVWCLSIKYSMWH